MGKQERAARCLAVAAPVMLAVFTLAAASAPALGAVRAAAGKHPAAGMVHVVSPASRATARAFWNPARMAAATPQAGKTAGAGAVPATTYHSPVPFAGVPTVGALFFTTGTQKHFCSASVVDSRAQDLVLTAAHCVYSTTYAQNIEFVPKYHYGHQPYGGWVVKSITVASGWKKSHDPNLDFAFLSVTPPSGTSKPIQQVTGGLHVGIREGYSHPIEVIGYNDTGNGPIRCATNSFKFHHRQMKFYCRNYQDGTSGGPWIIGFNLRTGTGTVFGVIGGYEQGGNYDWASYSAYFGRPTLKLFQRAQGGARG